MSRRSSVVLLAFGVLALTSTTVAAITDPVRIEQGRLAGKGGNSPQVRVYLGIPYAAPPVGELRWKAPQPPASWQGVRQATEAPNACWQTPYPPAAAIYQSKFPGVSEDCLYLNIWTPAKSSQDKLPVMVWIHGGGFTRGYGASEAYDGEKLARKGAVIVTINYRLGIFGFFAHPALSAESKNHASGNYALLDQIAALTWVKKNITAFGGDPGRVTIFGESAGSWSVNALMASPLAKGLFHRAIGESGASFSPMKSLADSETEGEKLGKVLTAGLNSQPPQSTPGPDDVIKALRAMSPEKLLTAYGADVVRPVVDGYVLPQNVAATFAQGKQNDVPLIAGYNADEGTTLAPQGAKLNLMMFSTGVRQRYGDMADQMLTLYPAGSDEEAVKSFYSAYRDQVFGWEMRTWVRMAAKTGHRPAYLYYFSRRPPGPQSERLRAFHASEIAYVFGNFPWPFPWEDADRKLSDAITSYWVNFAATGNPNGKGVPEWPVYSAAEDKSLEFGDQIAVRASVNKAGLDFFDGYYHSLAQERKSSGTGATAK